MDALIETLKEFRSLAEGKSLFFASDFHLGAPDPSSSEKRERKIVGWLEEVSKEAAAIFLVGDLFDFWYEYKYVIPKGFTLFLGKIKELRERDIPIYFFTGNHDMWMFDYFPKELDVPVLRNPVIIETPGHRLFVGHGDGLGPGDRLYKLIKYLFTNPFIQWLFGWIHPRIGFAIARAASSRSRISGKKKDSGFEQKEKEWLWHYCERQQAAGMACDFYVFGHRHVPLDLEVRGGSRYLNLGEWINHFTYVKYDGQQAKLLTFNS